MKKDISAADPDHKLIPIITTAQSIMTHTEATPDHTIGPTKDTTGVAHNAHTPPLTTIDPAMTHHIADHIHIEALLDHALDQPSHLPENICTDPLLAPADNEAKCISQGTPEIPERIHIL